MNSIDPNDSSRRDLAGREVVVSDMDDTLLASDLTVQSLQRLARRKPYLLPALMFWYLRGKSVAKAKLAHHAMPDVSSAPEIPEVLSYLKAKKAEGAWIVLASASNIKIVQATADRFGIFDQVLGSTPGDSFKGGAKADGLDAEFGPAGYTYIGDCAADLAVWSRAGKAVTVGASAELRARAEAVSRAFEHINPA